MTRPEAPAHQVTVNRRDGQTKNIRRLGTEYQRLLIAQRGQNRRSVPPGGRKQYETVLTKTNKQTKPESSQALRCHFQFSGYTGMRQE